MVDQSEFIVVGACSILNALRDGNLSTEEQGRGKKATP